MSAKYKCFLQTIHEMLTDKTGVVWITFDDVFMNCLDSHSDGTHSQQRINPKITG